MACEQNKGQKKPHMILSMDTEKSFDRIPFMIKIQLTMNKRKNPQLDKWHL